MNEKVAGLLIAAAVSIAGWAAVAAAVSVIV